MIPNNQRYHQKCKNAGNVKCKATFWSVHIHGPNNTEGYISNLAILFHEFLILKQKLQDIILAEASQLFEKVEIRLHCIIPQTRGQWLGTSWNFSTSR